MMLKCNYLNENKLLGVICVTHNKSSVQWTLLLAFILWTCILKCLSIFQKDQHILLLTLQAAG